MTGILLLSRSSFSLRLSSCSLRNLSSAIVCFLLRPSPLPRISYDAVVEFMMKNCCARGAEVLFSYAAGAWLLRCLPGVAVLWLELREACTICDRLLVTEQHVLYVSLLINGMRSQHGRNEWFGEGQSRQLVGG